MKQNLIKLKRTLYDDFLLFLSDSHIASTFYEMFAEYMLILKNKLHAVILSEITLKILE